MKKFLNSLSLKNRTLSYILLVLMLVLTILMLGQTYHKAWRIPDGNDFTLYLEASETFLQDKILIKRIVYLYISVVFLYYYLSINSFEL